VSSSKIPNVGLLKIRHYRTVSDDVHEQEISVTCELNNRIIKLKNEIERLYNSLTRLDIRFNREKRGLYETTTIVDCVEMKGKFNKIYEDLNRISQALSMIDNNGICRCKCPLDTITVVDTTTKVTRLTEIPFDIVTFASGNVKEHTPNTSEKTQLLKKITISNNKPQSVTNQFRNVFDREISTPTLNEENESTTILLSTFGDTITQEDTVESVDTKGDLSPEMSNAVTNSVKLKDNVQITVEPQLLYHTEIITNDYVSLQTHITSDTPTSSTDITDLNETVQTTELNSDRLYTAQEKKSNNKDVILKSTTENEYISESTTEILEPENNHSNTYITKKTPESAYENENISKLTISRSEPDNNYNNVYITEKTSQSTYENENILGSTTEILELDNNYSKTYVTKTTSESTSENENILGSTTEILELDNSYSKKCVTKTTSESTSENENISETTTTEILQLDNNYSKTYITEQTSESTSKIENISGLITETSKPNDNYYNNYNNTNITDRTVDFIFESKNISESNTEMSISNKNDGKTVVKERTSSEDRENHDNKLNNGTNSNQSTIIGDTNIENLDHSKLVNKYDDKSTLQQPEVIQQVPQKTYPICFYPVPCSQNVVNLNYRQNEEETNKNTIQYLAQSLNTYKRKPPVATVIQNDYPVLLICRTDVVCSVADFAGQSNRLHCMYSVNAANKNSEYTSNQTIKNYDNSTKDESATRAKSARNNDEILTGNKINI